jgi:hypothetical protein
VSDPKQFARFYDCKAKDIADLFEVSVSTAEKWVGGGYDVSPYHQNAIELQHQQFQALLMLEDMLEKQRKLLSPSKLEFFNNWREERRKNQFEI